MVTPVAAVFSAEMEARGAAGLGDRAGLRHLDLVDVVLGGTVLSCSDPPGNLRDAEACGDDSEDHAAEDEEGVCHGVSSPR